MIKKLLFIALLFVVALSACKKPAEVIIDPTAKDVTIKFNNSAGGQTLVLDDVVKYTSANGQMFSVSMLKYYIGQVKLHNVNGTAVTLPGYHLINEDPVTKKTSLKMAQVPMGKYNKITFIMGVDKSTNASGSQEGDLDASKGMYWEMTGYTFLKHEGRYKATNGAEKPLLIHFGTNTGLGQEKAFTFPAEMEIGAANKTININFDLAKAYSNGYDFNVNDFHMSSDISEVPWIEAYRDNLHTSFSLGAIQ
jgi:hypothetical protein